MPLSKRSSTATAEAPAVVPATSAPAAEAPATAKKLGGVRKPGDKAAAPMTKEDYWRRREERDIAKEEYFVAKDARICRSGVWQAALQSTGLLQLNTDNTLAAFLALVEKTANAGLEYVNRGE
jgi:hypothetical protein